MSLHPTPTSKAQSITRREALEKLSLGALLGLGLWPGAVRAAGIVPPKGEFTFIVVNDTHHMSPECSVWLKNVVERIRAEKPAFVLLVGDLVEKGEREHLIAVRDIFQNIGAPVNVQIGNHDWLTQTDRSAYEAIFPDRINYAFEHRGWQFVGLDSTDGVRWEKTLISEATLRWMDEQLSRLDRTRPLVLFTHFPLGAGVKMRPLNSEVLLSRFRDYNLQAVFNGHFHGHTERAFGAATVTTSRCCALKRANHDGTKEKGFLVCTARAGRVTRRFVEVPS